MPAEADIARLRERLREVDDLRAAASLLSWDQSTYMPRGGAEARGRHLATLHRLVHARLVDPELQRLLDRLRDAEAAAPDERELLRVVERDVQHASRIPNDFTAAVTEHTVSSYEAWTRARAAADFSLVAPALERTLEFSRRYAGFFPECVHPADALIDAADEGLTVAELRPLFERLRAALVPLLERVADDAPSGPVLPVEAPRESQLALALRFAAALGYDLDRGRQDLSPHPFAISMSRGDVRITTRVAAGDLAEVLFSTLHETGHALYEQGIDAALDGTPLAGGVSNGVHESQARLWENQVGRSRAFWRYALPLVREAFPGLGYDRVDDVYRAVNRVRRSLIRTDADEVTYNLHVIVRFDLELDMLEGRLAIADLPEAWNERYASDLGVRPRNDAEGVLQDIHWFAGLIGGAFQSYTIGNVLSAQCYSAAQAALGDLTPSIEAGDFAGLHEWLRRSVYAYGRRQPPAALIERVTGGPLRLEPYLEYLHDKYLDPALERRA